MSSNISNIKILLETFDFAIINKPAGLLAHHTHFTNRVSKSVTKKCVRKGFGALSDWVRATYPETSRVGDEPNLRPGIVHRLDKETSGVLLIARTQEFFEYFKNLLQTKQVQKTYTALCHGEVEAQIIDAPIGLVSGTTKRSTRAKKMKMIKPAITKVELVKLYKSQAHEYFTLARAYPKTGRTHQIRVHLASIGHPIVGDALYADKGSTLGLERHFLHASALEFSTPEGDRVKVESELPKELQSILDKLQNKR